MASPAPLFRLAFLLLCCMEASYAAAQEGHYIKVHFIYGSRPARHFHRIEKKWFGGLLGGHVGIEADSNRILNFFPTGPFHWLARKQHFNSTYAFYNKQQFSAFFSDDPDSMKQTVVIIPVSGAQLQRFDSIGAAYLRQSPYDYAFIGMRCASASYEILAQLGILPRYSRSGTVLRIFYPKRLRKRLLRQAAIHHWTVLRQQGTHRRRWERD